jgi:excisionase family DNA binding protein
MEGERMYTVPEVAEQLRLHQQTIREWLRIGKLHGIRLGGTKAGWRIPASEVERLLRGSSSDREAS